MKTHLLTAAALVALAGPASADSHAGSGDPAAGESAFNQCQTCHVVANEAGDVLAGRNAKTGPNLYEIAGRTAGTIEGFRYSKSMVEAGEMGLVWDEDNFVAYVQDPTGYLREYLDDRRARGQMAFKVRDEQTAADLYAYIVSLEE